MAPALERLRTAARITREDLLAVLPLGLAAAACRAMLTGIETRWQLLAFYAILAACELGQRRQRGLARLALNGFAVTFAMIAVKFAIDGRPHLHAVLAALHRLFG